MTISRVTTTLLPQICAGVYPKGVSRALCLEYRNDNAKLMMIAGKLERLWMHKPTYIKGSLKESALPSAIQGDRIRGVIVDTYNVLDKKGKLSVLDLPEDRLFTYLGDGSFTAHPAIREIAAKYMQKTISTIYSIPLRYTRQLRSSCLTQLEDFVLKEEKERLAWLVGYNARRIYSEYETFLETEKLKGECPADFPRGDFSFIPEAMTRRILSNGFQAIESAGLWNLLEGPYLGAFTYGEGELRTAMSVMDEQDGHSGASMGFVMHYMHQLHALGWEKFVELHLPQSKL
ncbi:MAG: hypothetical protein KBC64_04190 [Simkaniaceae bacterium]|nr:hypothetical protein [Simkaniaceae bacterium]